MLDKVACGEATPQEAEEEAKRRHAQPFAREPDPAQFDPTRETRWTLAMAIAWISFRSYDEVRHWWDPYRAQCRIWGSTKSRNPTTGEIEAGFDLRELGPAGVNLLLLQDMYQRDGVIQLMTASHAKSALWSALAEGSVIASALNPVTGAAEDLRPGQWPDLEIYDDGAGDEWLGLRRGLKIRTEVRLRHVTVPSRAIVERWVEFTLAKDVSDEFIEPTGPGFMPLSSAALWLLCHRGLVNPSVRDPELWRPVYRELLDRIVEGDVEVTGLRNGAPIRVDGIEFVGIEIEYPFAFPPRDPVRGEEVYLRSCLHVNDDWARRGFDDSLRDRFGVRYSRLMVRKADVREIAKTIVEPPVGPRRRGRPPSPKGLLLQELERRAAAGEMEPVQAVEARFLVQWLSNAHPEERQPKQATICRFIRKRHAELSSVKK